MASFLVPGDRQSPEPNALRALFLFMQKMPAKKLASFLVPHYSREPRHANRVRGFLLYFSKKLASKRHLFRSLVPGRARSRTRSGLFSYLCKKAPALMACVFFRSLFAGKARHCGAVKNFFQPPQEPSVLTGKNTPGHMPKESFRTYPSP